MFEPVPSFGDLRIDQLALSLLYSNCLNILRFILRRMVSAIQIINALSGGKSLLVFDLIAVKGGDRKSIINSLRLSPKQYHSRISALRKYGLVEKINGKYILTSFEVIHEARQQAQYRV